jgi:type VI secretion system protein ImpH
MVPESGAKTPPVDLAGLEDALRTDAHSFDFFQAVRILRLLHPEKAGVGDFALPRDEVVRFTANPNLGFPAGEIQDVHREEDLQPWMEVNFFGLVGNQGVLPLHYSRLVSSLGREGPNPLRAFLDIFQHRLTSLFYRAMEKGRFYVPFERGETDPVSSRLLELIGLRNETLWGRMSIPDHEFLFYAGLLGLHQRNAAALQRIIQDYLGVPTEIEQFVGGWYPLSEDSQVRLDDEFDDFSPRLGEETVVGDEFWDPQARVRIKIGPLNRQRYDDFLPGGQSHEALRALTTFFSDGQFDFDVQLVLAKEDVPPVVLGGDADAEAPLGWCTWIRTRPFDRDADQTTLSL